MSTVTGWPHARPPTRPLRRGAVISTGPLGTALMAAPFFRFSLLLSRLFLSLFLSTIWCPRCDEINFVSEIGSRLEIVSSKVDFRLTRSAVRESVSPLGGIVSFLRQLREDPFRRRQTYFILEDDPPTFNGCSKIVFLHKSSCIFVVVILLHLKDTLIEPSTETSML